MILIGFGYPICNRNNGRRACVKTIAIRMQEEGSTSVKASSVTATRVDERESHLIAIRMQDAILRTYGMTHMLLKQQ
jgi:hypothetical protein